ncbi:hypothetical protein ALC60_02641 [Trachymyrmex zeteki]|uniref:Uncharacterized protein n=1 Tax=Mycetomoellerius zeteki TaxID=64791 RepID=A0A151XCW7_9HYME|nr:hypothetical protein ALC60_02641 [Trachymyrmex zeteki]
MSTNDYVRNVGCVTLSAGLNLIYVEHSVNDESDAACDKRVASFSFLYFFEKNSFPRALLFSTLPHGLRAMFPAASFTDRNETIVEISDLT